MENSKFLKLVLRLGIIIFIILWITFFTVLFLNHKIQLPSIETNFNEPQYLFEFKEPVNEVAAIGILTSTRSYINGAQKVWQEHKAPSGDTGISPATLFFPPIELNPIGKEEKGGYKLWEVGIHKTSYKHWMPFTKEARIYKLKAAILKAVAEAETYPPNSITRVYNNLAFPANFTNKIVDGDCIKTIEKTETIETDDELAEYQMELNFHQFSEMEAIIDDQSPLYKPRVVILDGKPSIHEDINDSMIIKNIDVTSGDYFSQGHPTNMLTPFLARQKNGKGVHPLNPLENFEVVTINIADESEGKLWATHSNIIEGIYKAIELQADVIHIPYAGKINDLNLIDKYNEVVSATQKAGIIIVAAAGNNKFDDANNYFPGGLEGVIVVEGVNNEDKINQSLNHTMNATLSIAAFHQACVCEPRNKYVKVEGTSIASAYVALVVTLMKSIYPQITTVEAHEILSTTGRDKSRGNTTTKIMQTGLALKKTIEKYSNAYKLPCEKIDQTQEYNDITEAKYPEGLIYKHFLGIKTLLKKGNYPIHKTRLVVVDAGLETYEYSLKYSYYRNRKYEAKYPPHSNHRLETNHTYYLRNVTSKRYFPSDRPNTPFLGLNDTGINIHSLNPMENFEIITINENSYNLSSIHAETINGIQKAIELDADVLLIPHAIDLEYDQETLRKLLYDAEKAGITIIVPAGDYSGKDAIDYFPCNLDNVIVVEGVDLYDRLLKISNHTQNIALPIAALGEACIYQLGNDYIKMGGSPIASSYVALAVTLMKSIAPNITTTEIHQILSETGREKTEGNKYTKIMQAELAFNKVAQRYVETDSITYTPVIHNMNNGDIRLKMGEMEINKEKAWGRDSEEIKNLYGLDVDLYTSEIYDSHTSQNKGLWVYKPKVKERLWD